MSDKKISICTGVKNRNDRILPCIKSWLDWGLCDEFILIDWSSDDPVQDFLDKEGFNHPKLKVIRIEDKPYFEQAACNNASIEPCSNKNILRVDIDYILKKPQFWKKIILDINTEKEFLSGNYCGHLAGLCYFNKEHWIECGKYNTAFDEGWSMEDSFFYECLNRIGLTGMCVIGKMYELLTGNMDLPTRREKGGVGGLTIPEREELFGKIVYHSPHPPRDSAIHYKINDKATGAAHNVEVYKSLKKPARRKRR